MRNYFDAFGLPTQFMLDQNELKLKYLALQNILHPDRYAHASEREKLLALQKSTELNDAFNTLKSDLSRMLHLLNLSGVEIDDAKTTQDMDFLMQQMQLREQLDSASSAEALQTLQNTNTASLAQLAEQFDQAMQSNETAVAVSAYQKALFFSKLGQQITGKLKTTA